MEDSTTQLDVENVDGQVDETNVAADDTAGQADQQVQLVSQRDQVLAEIKAKREAARREQQQEEEPGTAGDDAAGQDFPRAEAQPQQPHERLHTIVVNGVEQVVTESELIEAGIREKQKERAADERLRLAAHQMSLLDKAKRELQARIAATNAAASKVAGIPDPESVADEFTQAMIDDEDKAKKIFSSVLKQQREQEQILREVLSTTRQQQEYINRIDTNRKNKLASLFMSNYGDLARDPLLAHMANEQTKILLRDRPDLTEEEIVLEAGRLVAEWKNPGSTSQGNRAVTSSQQQEVKREMPRQFKPAAGRMPATEQPRRKTRAEIIAEYRNTRQAGQRLR